MSDTTFKWNGSPVETELSYVWFNMPDGSKHGWPQVDMHEAERLAMFLNAYASEATRADRHARSLLKLADDEIAAKTREITRLSSEASALRAKVEDEKARRVYYQDIVYDVCNTLDTAAGRSVSKGQGIVCGTLNEPHDDVQVAVKELAAQRDAALAEVGRMGKSLAVRNAECAAWRNARNRNSVVENWGTVPAIQERIEKDCERVWNARTATDADGGCSPIAALTPPAQQQEKHHED